MPLKAEVKRIATAGAVRRAPEMTTKQDKLKVNRQAKLQQMFLDDLAALENFTVVGGGGHAWLRPLLAD
jgi:hypothetical protein